MSIGPLSMHAADKSRQKHSSWWLEVWNFDEFIHAGRCQSTTSHIRSTARSWACSTQRYLASCRVHSNLILSYFAGSNLQLFSKASWFGLFRSSVLVLCWPLPFRLSGAYDSGQSESKGCRNLGSLIVYLEIFPNLMALCAWAFVFWHACQNVRRGPYCLFY